MRAHAAGGFVKRIGSMLVAVLALLGCRAPDDGRLEAAERRIAQLERENAKLHARVTELSSDVWALSPGRVPPIEAVVLEVNPAESAIVLDKGTNDDVRIGLEFYVYRESTYKALVRVTDAWPRYCRAAVSSEKVPIERGDSATSNL